MGTNLCQYPKEREEDLSIPMTKCTLSSDSVNHFFEVEWKEVGITTIYNHNPPPPVYSSKTHLVLRSVCICPCDMLT